MSQLPPLPDSVVRGASGVDRSRYPYFHLVPLELGANLKFRKALLALASESRANANGLWLMCQADLLFWAACFCWTYDPRNPDKYPARPFIPYPFQIDALAAIDAAIGRHDLPVLKSRCMGASWMMLYVIQHKFQFVDLQTFLLISRSECLVDDTQNPDSLFWKLDFNWKYQPKWLRPPIVDGVHRTFLHLDNPLNGSTIDGTSTTGESGRGGRRTAILLDEFASAPNGYEMLKAAHENTNCLLINSTPKGTGNAYYDACQSALTLRLHWSIHPEKGAGLYRDAGGKLRSPAYDHASSRPGVTPQEMAQEWDMDFLGSDFQFFHGDVVRKCQERDVREPSMVGEFSWDSVRRRSGNFVDQPGGHLRLWMNLDVEGKAPNGEYAIGVDVATGTGASNSCVSIGERRTREKVAEFASADMDPLTLARMVAELGWWLGGAQVIWEDNGPGAMFRKRLLDVGYDRLWYRRDENSVLASVSASPGWWSTPSGKQVLLGEYGRALAEGEFINRSHEALDECRQYVYGGGSIHHSRSASAIDPSGARDNHADRVIADALLWKLLAESAPLEKAVFSRPMNSIGGRRMKREREKQRALEEACW